MILFANTMHSVPEIYIITYCIKRKQKEKLNFPRRHRTGRSHAHHAPWTDRSPFWLKSRTDRPPVLVQEGTTGPLLHAVKRVSLSPTPNSIHNSFLPFIFSIKQLPTTLKFPLLHYLIFFKFLPFPTPPLTLIKFSLSPFNHPHNINTPHFLLSLHTISYFLLHFSHIYLHLL